MYIRLPIQYSGFTYTFFTMRHLLLIFGLAVTASSCQQSESRSHGRAAKGDVHLGSTLRLAEIGLPESFQPEHLLSAVGHRLGNQVHCGLLRLDPVTLLPVPGIADRYETDSSGLTYVFHLRQGVKFHDSPCFGRLSREVTANDAAFSLRMLCRPGSPVFESTLKGRVEGADRFHMAMTDDIPGIRVIDDYTLQVTLTRPDESFLIVLAQPTAGIISQSAYVDCDMSVVGAGPFVPVAQRSAAGDLTLVRHQDFFATDAFGNRLPYIDSITVTLIPSKEVALERLLVGELDLVTGVYLDPVRSLLERHADEFTGADAKFMMQRNDDAATYEIYAIHSARLMGFRENFMGHRDFSVAQLKH